MVKAIQMGGLTFHVARCDDCDTVLLVQMSETALYAWFQRRDPLWRPGLPLFCDDLRACADRCYQRYGRYLQLLNEQITAMEAAQAKIARVDARQVRRVAAR